MTKEKELLLQDLSARLPYGVKVKFNNINILKLGTHTRVGEYVTDVSEPCKPYLFPMSSMTEEQKNELQQIIYVETEIICNQLKTNNYGIKDGKYHFNSILQLDWLNKNHFDYRGLIEKGLAIDAN